MKNKYFLPAVTLTVLGTVLIVSRVAYILYSFQQAKRASGFPTMTLILSDISDIQITPLGFVLLGAAALAVLVVLFRATVGMWRKALPRDAAE